MKKKTGKPKTMKALVESLRRNATRHELMLHGALQFALAPYDSGYIFQHPIGPYVADFYIGTIGLVIEADGSSHDTPWAVHHDCERTRFLESRGARVLRFDNRQIERNLINVVNAILEECRGLPEAGTLKPKLEPSKEPARVPSITNPREITVTICPPGRAKGAGDATNFRRWHNAHTRKKQ